MIQNRRDLTVPRIVSVLALVYLAFLIYQAISSFLAYAWPAHTYFIVANEVMEFAAIVTLIYTLFGRNAKGQLLLPSIFMAAVFIFAILSNVVMLQIGTWFPDFWRQIIFRSLGLIVFVFIAADARTGLKRVKTDFVIVAIYWLLTFFSRIIALMNTISALNIQTALFTYIFPSFLSAAFIILLILMHHMRNNKRGVLNQIDQNAPDQSESLEEQLEALDQLYAQGGITYKEYTEKRKELIRQS